MREHGNAPRKRPRHAQARARKPREEPPEMSFGRYLAFWASLPFLTIWLTHRFECAPYDSPTEPLRRLISCGQERAPAGARERGAAQERRSRRARHQPDTRGRLAGRLRRAKTARRAVILFPPPLPKHLHCNAVL